MSVASTLREIPLFSQLREGDLAVLAKVTHERSYPKNSMILFASDPGDALYVILSGQVKVVLGAADGREVILSIRSKECTFIRKRNWIGSGIPRLTQSSTITREH